eukprot:scaffold221219_cov52-Attheya_sp.AAC.3
MHFHWGQKQQNDCKRREVSAWQAQILGWQQHSGFLILSILALWSLSIAVAYHNTFNNNNLPLPWTLFFILSLAFLCEWQDVDAAASSCDSV